MTKVFTALLLADMAERGEVRLSDPAASCLPGWPGGTGSVTLADLATHTSGLPRLPRSLLASALLHPRDPYARYPAARFVRAARRALRAGSGGSPYVYSNFGYGLLGYLLGQAAGTGYQTLVTTRICGPLGLPDTTFEVPGRPWTERPRATSAAVRSPTGAWAPWPPPAPSTPPPPTWAASCKPAWPRPRPRPPPPHPPRPLPRWRPRSGPP